MGKGVGSMDERGALVREGFRYSRARQTDHDEVFIETVGQRGSPGSISLRARTVAGAKSPHHARPGDGRARGPGRRAGMNASGTFVGIDVSKQMLDVAVRPSGERWRTTNDERGIKELVSRLRPMGASLVVMEATGGYETALALAMVEAKIAMRIVNPRQVRDFAKGKGLLAKTDSLDAAVLAEYGETYRPEARGLRDAQAREMADILSRRRQLIEMKTAENNRLEHARGEVRKEILAHLSWLSRRIKKIDEDLDKKIRNSPLYLDKRERLKSVPGVGNQTALSLILNLPELGTLNRKQIAALAGVAPFNKDSGQRRGKRAVWGGRAQVRAVLYMAAVVASRHNDVIRDFYAKLCAAGKPKKLALTVCMRKLLTVLNAMAKNQTSWTPSLATSR